MARPIGSLNVNPDWLDAAVEAVVQSLTADVRKYDEATLTMDDLKEKITRTIERTVSKSYDHGFEHGITAQVDEDEEGCSQLEFDLDELRTIGEEDDEAE